MSIEFRLPMLARAATIPVMVAVTAVAGLAVPPPAHAGTEQPPAIAADVAHLGTMSAITYYTEEQDGFHVVTTVQDDGRDTALPVRFVATLQAGQKATVSVPRLAPGAPSWALELVRDGDHLVVHHSTEQPAPTSASR